MGKKIKNQGKYRIDFIRNKIFFFVFLIFLLNILVSSISSVNINNNKGNIVDNNYYEYNILFSSPKFSDITINGDSFSKISMENCINNAEAGFPSLPKFPIKVLVPYGKDIKDIEIINPNPKQVLYNFIEKPIIPQQSQISINSLNENIEFSINKDAYILNRNVENEIYSGNQISFSRGYKILSLFLHPVKYIPLKGELFYYPELTIRLELEDSSEYNSLFRNNIEDKEWVEKLVLNPELVNTYEEIPILNNFNYENGLCDPSDEYQYVIITTRNNNLNDWPTSQSIPYNWTSLMENHTADYGWNCTLVTIEDIVNCTDYWNSTELFNDTQALIREFCKDAYQDWGTSYILIGGDDEYIPARKMNSACEEDIESDLYWSNLDLTFNSDQDSAWGEEGDNGFDAYSELYIGRLTCDEPQDVSNWMKKSFYYKNSDEEDYINTAGFYAGITGWACEGDDFIEFSAINGTSNWLGPIPGHHGSYPSWLGFLFGFKTWNSENPLMTINLSAKWTAEPTNTGWRGGDENSAIAGFKDEINNNNVSLISGIAHANQYYSLDASYLSWESDYHNTKPFFVHDFGCHCGDMTAADDGVLHSMLFHSDTELAFGCVYNTGYGWGSYYDTNSSSALQQKLFWDYFFDTVNNSGGTSNWQLGKAMAYSKDSMANTINWTYFSLQGYWRSVLQGCLLFADPAQKIRILSNDTLRLNNEIPNNSSINVGLQPRLSINVDDLNHGILNLTWFSNSSNSWVEFASNNSINTSTGSQNIFQSNQNFSNYNTTYYWSVNLTNSTHWKNETYHFTTRDRYVPNPPASFTATKYNRSGINIVWTNSGSNNTYIEYNTSSDDWEKGQGILIDNSSTNTSYQHRNLSFGTTYYYKAWSWNQTDNNWSTTNTSSNATTEYNYGPLFSNENPSNNSINVDINQNTVNLTIIDLEGDWINWTIQGNYLTDFGVDHDTNGSKSINLNTPIPFNREIVWYVNSTDGYNHTNATYNFTVRGEYIPNPPSGFNAGNYNNTIINLSWTNAAENKTYIEYNTSSEHWQRGEGLFIDNTTNTSFNHTNLCSSSKYYYQAWSWNQTDNTWSTTNISSNATTNNSAPTLTNENPQNQSSLQDLNTTCNITANDVDKDSLTLYFYENTTGIWTLQQINNTVSDGEYIIWNNYSNASNYNTLYWWSVNITDGFNWTNETYHFRTIENQAVSFSSISPPNGSTDISISRSSLSLTITDTEEDTFNWTIDTNPDIGNNSANNNSNGQKTCSISGLNYDTTYYWTVCAKDSINNTWVNSTYHFTTEEEDTGGNNNNNYNPYVPPQNNPPNKPIISSGTILGYTNVSYNFTINGTDPNGNELKYQVDWGDGSTSTWTDLYDSGQEIILSHLWNENGTYLVKVKSKDSNSLESEYSNPTTIVIIEQVEIEIQDDEPKAEINVSGYNQTGKELLFKISDIESLGFEGNLTYLWDLGDCTEKIGLFVNHSYKFSGLYKIIFKIYNETGSLLYEEEYNLSIDAEGQVTSLESDNNDDNLLLFFMLIGLMISTTLTIVIFLLFYYKKQNIKKKNPNENKPYMNRQSQFNKNNDYDSQLNNYYHQKNQSHENNSQIDDEFFNRNQDNEEKIDGIDYEIIKDEIDEIISNK